MQQAIEISGPVDATFRVPGSKSITNRALVCSALAEGVSEILNASDSDDSSLMANGLNLLGVLARRRGTAIEVHGTAGNLHAPKFPIPVGNAGTTLRFLLSVASIAYGRTRFEGSGRMAERPMSELLDALRALGVTVTHTAGTASFEVEGGTLSGGSVVLPGGRSSQFISSLLMVAPYAASDVEIRVGGVLTSAPYVDLTMAVMKAFGVDVDSRAGGAFRVRAGQRYRAAEFGVEADASGATYPFAAAAITGGRVRVEGLSLTSLQGDTGFVKVLQEMGCTVEEEGGAITVRGTRALRGVDVDMNRMPDAVPALAVTALFAGGATRIRNVSQLRHKESDRIGALASELVRVGGEVRVLEDGLEIRPGQLHGATVDTYDDHRMAMSFALVGLRVPGIIIESPGCVRKSFPGFWEEFGKFKGS